MNNSISSPLDNFPCRDIIVFGIITTSYCIQRGGGIRALRNPATDVLYGANSPGSLKSEDVYLYIALKGAFFYHFL